MSNIIQSRGFLDKTLGNVISNLDKKALLDLAVFFAKDVLPKLATKAILYVLDKSIRKTIVQGAIATSRAVTAAKGFPLFISNEGLNDIMKIVESLEKSGLLVDGATETVKHKIKKGEFLRAMIALMTASMIAPIVSFLIQFVASSLINALSGKGVMRSRKGQKSGFFFHY